MTLEEKKILQAMTPEQRILAAAALYHADRKLKLESLRQLHPDWTESQIADAVRKSFVHVEG